MIKQHISIFLCCTLHLLPGPIHVIKHDNTETIAFEETGQEEILVMNEIHVIARYKETDELLNYVSEHPNTMAYLTLPEHDNIFHILAARGKFQATWAITDLIIESATTQAISEEWLKQLFNHKNRKNETPQDIFECYYRSLQGAQNKKTPPYFTEDYAIVGRYLQ